MTILNLYDIDVLTDAILKSKYRQLMKECHPDRHQNEPEEVLARLNQQAVDINNAYDYLKTRIDEYNRGYGKTTGRSSSFDAEPDMIEEYIMLGLRLKKGISVAKLNELGGAKYFCAIAGPFADVNFVVTGCLDDRDLSLVSNPRIAAVGGVWMFQKEDDHTIFAEEKIVNRLKKSIELGRYYRNEFK